MNFFIWPINSGVLTSLLFPHLSSFLADSLPSLNLLCHLKTYALFMQDAPKAVWSIPCGILSKFKNRILLRIVLLKYPHVQIAFLKFTSGDKPGFSRVYSNSCRSCSFQPEIINIGQSSHKMYSNNILNSPESMTILNAWTKKVWILLKAPGTSGQLHHCNRLRTSVTLRHCLSD